MYIRRADVSEASTLSALAMESKSYWPYSERQLEVWREDLAVSSKTISSFPTYVAEVEANIVAFYVLLPAPKRWTLEHFWVAPRCMGCGVGRALLSHAAGVAAAGGAGEIAIDADPNAESFYVACGADRVGSIAAPIEGSPRRERPQMLLSLTQSR